MQDSQPLIACPRSPLFAGSAEDVAELEGYGDVQQGATKYGWHQPHGPRCVRREGFHYYKSWRWVIRTESRIGEGIQNRRRCVQRAIVYYLCSIGSLLGFFYLSHEEFLLSESNADQTPAPGASDMRRFFSRPFLPFFLIQGYFLRLHFIFSPTSKADKKPNIRISFRTGWWIKRCGKSIVWWRNQQKEYTPLERSCHPSFIQPAVDIPHLEILVPLFNLLVITPLTISSHNLFPSFRFRDSFQCRASFARAPWVWVSSLDRASFPVQPHPWALGGEGDEVSVTISWIVCNTDSLRFPARFSSGPHFPKPSGPPPPTLPPLKFWLGRGGGCPQPDHCGLWKAARPWLPTGEPTPARTACSAA